MKPTLSLLLFAIAFFAFVGMLTLSEYAFMCRMIILSCICVIVAVKLVKINEGEEKMINLRKLRMWLIKIIANGDMILMNACVNGSALKEGAYAVYTPKKGEKIPDGVLAAITPINK